MGLPYDVKVTFLDEDTSEEILWIEGLPCDVRVDDVVVLNDIEHKVESVSLYLSRTVSTPGEGSTKTRISKSECIVKVSAI